MKRGFTQVPNAIVCGEVGQADGRQISVGARALYALILNYSRNGERSCTASRATLAEQLGCSVRTVCTWLRELDVLGLVERRRRGPYVTSEIRPLVTVDRKSASRHGRQPSADKEDAQGEEDAESVNGDAVVVPVRENSGIEGNAAVVPLRRDWAL